MGVTITKQMLDKIHHIDLVDFIMSAYHVNLTSRSPSRVMARCPHPDHDDRKPSFSAWFDPKTNEWCWCCYSCHCGKHNNNKEHRNYGRDAIAFVRWMSDYKDSKHVYTFQEAAVIVLKYLGIEIKDNNNWRPNPILKALQINKKVANGCHKYLMQTKEAAYDYLVSRDLNDRDMDEWLIGYNGERIVFPFKDKTNNIIGFTMRTVGNPKESWEAKYINSPNSDIFDKSSYLYGIHLVDTSKNYLIITEGQMDVIAAYKYGLDNVVATSSAHFTQKHIEYIKKNLSGIEKLIFIYDADKAGQTGLKNAVEIARSNGYMVEYYNLPEDTDLFDFMMENKEKAAEIILTGSLPYFYQELESEVRSFENFILNYQAKVIPKLKDILDKTKNKNEKSLLQAYIYDKLKLDIKERRLQKNEFIKTG